MEIVLRNLVTLADKKRLVPSEYLAEEVDLLFNQIKLHGLNSISFNDGSESISELSLRAKAIAVRVYMFMHRDTEQTRLSRYFGLSIDAGIILGIDDSRYGTQYPITCLDELQNMFI